MNKKITYITIILLITLNTGCIHKELDSRGIDLKTNEIEREISKFHGIWSDDSNTIIFINTNKTYELRNDKSEFYRGGYRLIRDYGSFCLVCEKFELNLYNLTYENSNMTFSYKFLSDNRVLILSNDNLEYYLNKK